MGTTNSGKSTLINSLLKANQRNKLEKKGVKGASGLKAKNRSKE